ncbi:hypothetical protein Cni_G08947 [Canna indica]|uniref:Uncharacterized protein n=1 Tax=Canna indica TaxID=4628 RepID=A0AAQ3K1G0_9LILI|nr:hypothetical protein Cni_G08947 [Canna indica]
MSAGSNLPKLEETKLKRQTIRSLSYHRADPRLRRSSPWLILQISAVTPWRSSAAVPVSPTPVGHTRTASTAGGTADGLLEFTEKTATTPRERQGEDRLA